VETGSVLAEIVLQHQVEQFLYYEAELLDTWLWSEWLELFTEDMHYFMPLRKNRLRRQRGDDELTHGIHMAHFDDDRKSMEVRVRQKESGRHWAEDPPSRCRHLITNVRIDHSIGTRDELGVKSNFLCYRNRLESEVDLWAGERKDVFRYSGDSFLIAKRTILLDQNVVVAKNLSVFL
jgi:biphenyl 2,3-dioxygenase beta subunit